MDDSSGEWLGQDLQQDLLQAGAIDFYFSPVQMKKGRPGLKLSVLAGAARLDEVADFILEHTPTIGLRYYAVERRELPRRMFSLSTPYGPVQVKEVSLPSGMKRHKIEYEDLRRLSRAHGLSLLRLQQELYALLQSKAGNT